MKRRIDLRGAADAESFGALAVGASREHRNSAAGNSGAAGRPFTEAQSRALSEMAISLVQIARSAGAEQQPVVLKGVSLELREHLGEEILAIRTSTGT